MDVDIDKQQYHCPKCRIIIQWSKGGDSYIL